MPPFTGWYQGPDVIADLIDTQCPGGARDMPMLPRTSNGQPAFGLYLRAESEEERFLPFQLQVLELTGDRVSHVVVFFDTDSFIRPRAAAGARR